MKNSPHKMELFNHMGKYRSHQYLSQTKISTRPSRKILALIPGEYGFYNKAFALNVSLPTAVILSELLMLDEYYHDRLINHYKHGSGWFSATVEFLQKRTSILRREQSNCIEKLVKLGFIEVAVFGIPALRHIRVKKQAIKEHFEINQRKEL